MTVSNIRCLQICGVQASTQVDFAEMIGVNRWILRKWYQGNTPSARSLVKMAKLARSVNWTPEKCTGFCK